MKKYIILMVVALFNVNNHDAQAQMVINRCSHAGIQYMDIPLGSNCPDYDGGDAGIPSGWIHIHKGDNSDSYHIGSGGEHISEGDPEHCLITKDYIEGPPQQMQ
jgi:hypothetical protein